MKSIIYPKDFEIKLGFDLVRKAIAEKCSSNLGREFVEKMIFSDSYTEVLKLLNQVYEMKMAMNDGNDYPRPILYDINHSLKAIKTQGGYMSTEDMYHLLLMIETMKEVKDFYCINETDENNTSCNSFRYPHLASIFSELENYPELSREIKRCINKFGEVADNASEELFTIRKALIAANNAVNRAMRKALDNAIAHNIVDKDTTPSMRDGRMVIPVEAASKRQLNGIIHDESSTGKTVFIEPAEVVEASNRLKELKMEEHRAVIAVLIALANKIRPFVPQLLKSLYLLGLLDFIMAKASYAISTDANLPILEETPDIDWYSAFHPILYLSLKRQNRDVVPLTVSLNNKNRFLIISGPNAGGKSVVLKTVGIVQYMTQCGVLPTLNYNSHVGIFSSIFIDIGDEQSIENDLSTYSSHLKNMKFFLSHSNKDTLILADEMGSGTEPQIGGALAQSILDSLYDTGCKGIITTHYQNLKTYAEDKEGFINGAMQYDRGKLKPTFILSVGNPGSSFALEIAKNIGLPNEILHKAKEIVGSDYVKTDKYLLDIDRDRRYWHNKRQQIKEKENKLNTLLENYENVSATLRSQRSQILNEARKEAKEILASVNSRIESTIKEIRDTQAERERTKEIRRQLEEYKKGLDEVEAKENNNHLLKPLRHKSRNSKATVKEENPKSKIGEISVGDYVKMSDGGVTGKVLSIQGKKGEVAFGSLRTFVELNKLRLAVKPKEIETITKITGSSGVSDASRKRQLNFKTEIDVRGMRADEALQAVSYFIDDAVQFEIPRIRILHGTGHGILRSLIRQQLSVNNAVSHYADEDVRFGGAGITVVDLN